MRLPPLRHLPMAERRGEDVRRGIRLAQAPKIDDRPRLGMAGIDGQLRDEGLRGSGHVRRVREQRGVVRVVAGPEVDRAGVGRDRREGQVVGVADGRPRLLPSGRRVTST